MSSGIERQAPSTTAGTMAGVLWRSLAVGYRRVGWCAPTRPRGGFRTRRRPRLGAGDLDDRRAGDRTVGSRRRRPGARVRGGDLRRHGWLTGDTGSAIVDFALVGALVTVLFVGVLQLTIVLHVRNTLVDTAAEGARYGALGGHRRRPTGRSGPVT